MAINDDIVYEMNDRGQRIVVRSRESVYSAYLRFTNLTSRPVDVWWRDFNGVKRHYVRLEPGASNDINSFLTHPWQFTDASTRECFVINNKPIFRPPNHIGGMLYRTNWNITVKVRSLRTTAMLAVAQLLPNPEAATGLDIPIILSKELYQLVTVLKNTPPVVSRRAQ